jgi:hypothetical protein
MDENKILEQFAKVLNVDISSIEYVKEEIPVAKLVLKKSFKEIVKENKEKIKTPVIPVKEESTNTPVTLFQLIKQELERS